MLLRYVLLLMVTIPLFAQLHYARVEPINRYIIKSDVSGKVVYSAKELEGKFVKNKIVIKIDDSDERIKLVDAKEALAFERENLHLIKDIVPQLKESYDRQEAYFQRLSSVSSSSQAQKDNAYLAMVNAKNQYISAKEKLLITKEKISQLNKNIALLQKTISRKSISLHNRYLYTLLVKEGNFVSMGQELIRADDINGSRLTIYVDRDELDGIGKKKIYIDDKLNQNAKLDKVWRVSDLKFISKYRVEITVKPPLSFSKLVKVELKDD